MTPEIGVLSRLAATATSVFRVRGEDAERDERHGDLDARQAAALAKFEELVDRLESSIA